jgi:hypothetical protein
MSSIFQKYYKNEDYKQKHLSYMKQKVACPLCGKLLSRSNMSHHNKTAKEHKYKQLIEFEALTCEQVDELMTKLMAKKNALTNILT